MFANPFLQTVPIVLAEGGLVLANDAVSEVISEANDPLSYWPVRYLEVQDGDGQKIEQPEFSHWAKRFFSRVRVPAYVKEIVRDRFLAPRRPVSRAHIARLEPHLTAAKIDRLELHAIGVFETELGKTGWHARRGMFNHFDLGGYYYYAIPPKNKLVLLSNTAKKKLTWEQVMQYAKTLEGAGQFIFYHRFISDMPLTHKELAWVLGWKEKDVRKTEQRLLDYIR